MDRRTKELVVQELHGKLQEATMVVLANFRGLNVGKMTELRNALRSEEAELRVVKNTLMKIASQDTPFVMLEGYFNGPIAVMFKRGDVVQPTKVLVEFAKKNAEIDIAAGMLEGKLLTPAELGVLAELPSRDVLLGKLLSLFVAMQTSLVSVLSAVPRSFVQVVDAYRSKKESEH